jgi:hypothetical protein
MAGVLLAGTALAEPIGIRNNNPLNIRELPGDTTIWLGEAAQDTSPFYEEFSTPQAGLRAGALLLINYRRIYGIDTVDGLIERFAPAKDGNPTKEYVSFVSKRLGVGSEDRINLGDPAILLPLLKALIHFENGYQPYSDTLLRKAINSLELRAP